MTHDTTCCWTWYGALTATVAALAALVALADPGGLPGQTARALLYADAQERLAQLLRFDTVTDAATELGATP